MKCAERRNTLPTRPIERPGQHFSTYDCAHTGSANQPQNPRDRARVRWPLRFSPSPRDTPLLLALSESRVLNMCGLAVVCLSLVGSIPAQPPSSPSRLLSPTSSSDGLGCRSSSPCRTRFTRGRGRSPMPARTFRLHAARHTLAGLHLPPPPPCDYSSSALSCSSASKEAAASSRNEGAKHRGA